MCGIGWVGSTWVGIGWVGSGACDSTATLTVSVDIWHVKSCVLLLLLLLLEGILNNFNQNAKKIKATLLIIVHVIISVMGLQ